MGIALPAQGFSFARFNVDASNRAAFLACRAIAEQRSTGPAPLVLRGAAGCGKTHLLCATAQMLRGQRPDAILALVMPHALPDRVRSLAEDPAPLAAGRPVPEPSIAEQREVLLEHYRLAEQSHGPRRTGPVMRGFGIKYARMHPAAGEVRAAFIAVRKPPDWHAVIDEWYK